MHLVTPWIAAGFVWVRYADPSLVGRVSLESPSTHAWEGQGTGGSSSSLSRGGEGDLFWRQQLRKSSQPRPAVEGAPALGAALLLGAPAQPLWRGHVHPVLALGGRWVRSRDPEVGAGTAEVKGGESWCRLAADVYVGQREPAGGRLQPGPGFRARSFSRLTGGQWAGARAGGGPGGLLRPP